MTFLSLLQDPDIISYYKKELIILRYCTKHAQFEFGVQFSPSSFLNFSFLQEHNCFPLFASIYFLKLNLPTLKSMYPSPPLSTSMFFVVNLSDGV